MKIHEGPNGELHATGAVIPCQLCGEVIESIEDRATVRPLVAHRDCLLRSATGGIGHLEDHELWCVQVGDPDGGHSYRESARLVVQWIKEHGVDAAAER